MDWATVSKATYFWKAQPFSFNSHDYNFGITL